MAPYRAWVNIRIVQQLDIYGKNTFEILLDIDFQEAATTRTGHEGFMSVYHFNGQTFANSKGEVESRVCRVRSGHRQDAEGILGCE